MVDVDRRPAYGFSPAHFAGLRRLSTRAAAFSVAGGASAPPRRSGLLPLAPMAESLVSLLRAAGVSLLPGLSAAELARAEAELAFSFPPDLRALLSLALPSAPGFPDWRRLPLLRLPVAAASAAAASLHRSHRHRAAALRRAPLLIPLFHRFYLPSNPPLAGNPVFFVDDDRIAVAAADLADFFNRHFGGPEPPTLRTPRWIEFWSDAAADRRRRSSSASTASASSSSSSSSPDPDEFLEIRPPRTPRWVGKYLDRIGSILKAGGWEEKDVSEMVEAEALGAGGGAAVGSRAVMDTLALKADRCSNSLRRAGWSSDDVSDALSFEFPHRRRPPLKLPPAIAIKIGQLAETVCRS